MVSYLDVKSKEIAFNPDYVIELRNEGLKCNKTATYGDEA